MKVDAYILLYSLNKIVNREDVVKFKKTWMIADEADWD